MIDHSTEFNRLALSAFREFACALRWRETLLKPVTRQHEGPVAHWKSVSLLWPLSSANGLSDVRAAVTALAREVPHDVSLIVLPVHDLWSAALSVVMSDPYMPVTLRACVESYKSWANGRLTFDVAWRAE